MPLYVYQATGEGCEHCRDGFEALQGMSETPLERCPRCGAEVRKVPVSFSAGKGNVLSDGNLRSHGFQKLRRTDEGGYRREV